MFYNTQGYSVSQTEVYRTHLRASIFEFLLAIYILQVATKAIGWPPQNQVHTGFPSLLLHLCLLIHNLCPNTALFLSQANEKGTEMNSGRRGSQCARHHLEMLDLPILGPRPDSLGIGLWLWVVGCHKPSRCFRGKVRFGSHWKGENGGGGRVE